MNVLLLLFTSPVQHRNSERVVALAKAFKEQGDSVTVFLLGDGVYNQSADLASAPAGNAASEFAGLDGVRVTGCSTCAFARGVTHVLRNTELGGLEDLCSAVEGSGIVLSFTSEC